MATRLMSQSPRVSFRDEGKLRGQRSSYDRGFSTQESEMGTPRSGMRGHKQGEFSGMFDKKGHHLKSDGTPDMRFKENREEFEGEGFEGTTQGRGAQRQERGTQREEMREEKRGQLPSAMRRTRGKSTQERSISMRRRGISGKGKMKMPSKGVTHKKSDETPDMRYKENRERFSGQGFENTTSRPSLTSKANIGLYEGNTPGEHSGKYDDSGHHLKNDGTPDMRFKENRDEFTGQGYENYGKTARYKQDMGDNFDKTILYRRKRPPTPYAIYIRENASQMKKSSPDMDMNEVFRELADQWRNSSQKEKDEYYKMYDEEVRNYEESMQHRGQLSMRKMAERRGLRIKTNLGNPKRGKSSSGRKRYSEPEETNTDEEEDETYNPEEENMNPNQN